MSSRSDDAHRTVMRASLADGGRDGRSRRLAPRARLPAAALALCCAFGGDALAELTPMGAEAAGNADGSIPAWSEIVNGAKSPGGSSSDLADPYPGDTPLFVINAKNVRTQASRLSAGHLALFARHGGYSMPVFPSRRNVSFPREVYEASARNAQTARMQGVDGISGVRLGTPFLQPRSGAEVLWNHRLRYHFNSVVWRYTWGVVWNNGSRPETGRVEERVLFRYANSLDPADLAKEDSHSYTEMTVSACEGRNVAAAAVWHDPVNALANARKLWVYFLGRTMRTPPLGYDTVDLCSHFIRYFDMFDMFNGGFDRYVFNLVGKRELYVPYNSFRLASAEGAGQLLSPGHLAQTRARYELHRVWQVEASLRPGARHAIARRVFYVDEDTWSILLVDGYGNDGKLIRLQEGHLLPIHAVKGADYAPVVTYDLSKGRYFAERLLAGAQAPSFNDPGVDRGDFSPGGLARRNPRVN